MQKVRSELYSPKERTNAQTEALTKATIEVWCTGMLKTLKDGEGSRYITGGEYGIDKQTELMKEHFRSTYRNTDKPCESYFGLLKYVLSRFANMSIESADAVAMALRNGLFSTIAPRVVKQRKARRQRKNASKRHKKKKDVKVARDGRLELRSLKIKRAMIACSRRGAETRKSQKRADKAEADENSLQLRAKAIKKKLEAQVVQYVAAVKSFNAPAIPNASALEVQLNLLETTKQKAECVKNQIKRLVDGCGLSECKVQFASGKEGSTIGKEGTEANLAHLKRALLGIWAKISRDGIELPTEAAIPQLKRRRIPTIGTITHQRAELDREQMRSEDEIKAAAAELAAQPKATRAVRSGPTALPVDGSLAGKSIRFFFEMTYKEKGKKTVTGLFECPGTIDAVSDRDEALGKAAAGAGFAHISWADGEESIQLLRPGFYGQHRSAGWRITADGDDAELDEEYEFEDADDDDEGDGNDADGSDSDDEMECGD